jgi:hypothetical protein
MELGETRHIVWTDNTTNAKCHAFYDVALFSQLVEISGPRPTLIAKIDTTSLSAIIISSITLILAIIDKETQLRAGRS